MDEVAEDHPQDSDIELEAHGFAFLGVTLFLVVFVAIVLVAVVSLSGSDSETDDAQARAAQLSKLPPFWKVRRGDTYSLIAEKTGLTIEELETFNPYLDPSELVPGQRVKLRKNTPKPKPKPLGPRTYVIRSGDTFASVAERFGHSIGRLQELNPKLRPTALQPGDRIRLRRAPRR